MSQNSKRRAVADPVAPPTTVVVLYLGFFAGCLGISAYAILYGLRHESPPLLVVGVVGVIAGGYMIIAGGWRVFRAARQSRPGETASDR